MKNYSSHIGIVGGGIAGLAVGCALRLQGIDTIVFERADEVSEYGVGISISPNALRPLQERQHHLFQWYNQFPSKPLLLSE